MKRSFYTAIFTLITAFAVTELRAAQTWSEPVKLINEKITSKTVTEFLKKHGSPKRIKSASGFIYDFESRGISITCENEAVTEIHLQIAPGMRISDVPYSGTLPDKVMESRNGPGKAIELLGKPARDNGQGYRKLTYPIEDLLMTLYYGPQLDAVSFSKAKVE